MQQVQQQRLDALHRIRSFMDENADALGDVNESFARTALDEVLTLLEARASAQVACAVQATAATQHKNELREELRRRHMLPIAAVAGATLAHTPYIADLRLPRHDVNDSTLVAAGNAMAEVAAQYTPAFLAEKLPGDFIEQLRAAVEAVRQAAVTRDAFQRTVTEATHAVTVELVRAKNVVKVLDALVTRQLSGRADLLAGWRRAKHAKVKGGVSRGTTATAPVESTAPDTPDAAESAESSVVPIRRNVPLALSA